MIADLKGERNLLDLPGDEAGENLLLLAVSVPDLHHMTGNAIVPHT